MDIYLSVNNRAEVLQIPVIPSQFTITKPQSLTVFETVSKGELQLIGTPKLKGIVIESFFPIAGHNYSYVRNTTMWGWEYINKIDDWIGQKLPIRLIVSGTPINMVVAVKDFSYTMKTDGDIWYTLDLEQFNLLGYENPEEYYEEELSVGQYEELKNDISYLQGVTSELANPNRYVEDNIPAWAQEAVAAAKKKNVLDGTDEGLNLSMDNLRTLTWMHRAGLFK